MRCFIKLYLQYFWHSFISLMLVLFCLFYDISWSPFFFFFFVCNLEWDPWKSISSRSRKFTAYTCHRRHQSPNTLCHQHFIRTWLSTNLLRTWNLTRWHVCTVHRPETPERIPPGKYDKIHFCSLRCGFQ